MSKILKKIIPIVIIVVFISFTISVSLAATPASNTYKLVDYGFGGGGTASSSSGLYSLFGILGETSQASMASGLYNVRAGLTYDLQANIPPAPTLTNPGTTYDRLKFVLDTGGNPTDATFAIAISTDNFVTDIRYVKADGTIGTSLTPADFLTYTGWGGASGSYVTNLIKNTTYSIKVKASQGWYTQTPYGPTSASVSTSDPSLTFSVDSSTVTFSNLNAGNSYTDNTKTTVLTTSTNAYNGYVVNARETGALTHTTNPSSTIANYASPNSAPTTWSGTGFGYTTSDTSLTGGTANRFASGTKYAGFTTSSPGDPVADHAGPVTTAISNEQFTITYNVAAAVTTQAGRYTTTVLYIAVPEY